MKIVHLADIHLGYRAYYRLSSEGLNIREKDVLRAFKEALDKIKDINPDIIIMAGDIFHKPRPSNSTIYNTIILLRNFRESCNAPIIMISGNHEAARSKESGSVLKIFESIISRVKVIDDDIESVQINNLDTNILCVPYSGLSGIEKSDLKSDKSFKYNILAIHGSYNSAKCPELSKHGNEYLINDSDIYQSEWDYIAFGHYHKYTELAPNTFYSGAIERTSTNIWQEAKDPKGFIVYDMDNKTHEFIKLDSPRKVIDIKRIDADNISSEELNQKINEEISKIKDLDKSIIRLTIENIDNIALRELDYKKLREFKKIAVHFRINLIKKDLKSSFDKNEEISENKKGLFEYLDEELNEFELSQGLNKDKFSTMARNYLQMSDI